MANTSSSVGDMASMVGAASLAIVNEKLDKKEIDMGIGMASRTCATTCC